MPEIINQNEASGPLRETTVQIKDLAGNPLNGITLGGGGATLLIAKPGGSMGASAGASLSQTTGGNVTDGLYRLQFAQADVDTKGDLHFEIAQIGTIQPVIGYVTVRDAPALASDARFAHLDADVSSRLAPSTGGRTLDVNATHGARIDWGAVDNVTTAHDFSATSIASVDGAVASVTGAVGSVTGNVGGNVNGNVNGTVASVISLANNAISAGSLAAGALTAIAGAIMGAAVESGLTLAHALQGIFAQAANKVSGYATNSPKYRDFADTKNRISGTTTADGRTSVTFSFD